MAHFRGEVAAAARAICRAEQRAAFPSAGDDEIAVQAGRLAQMHLLQSYLEDRGLIADRRRRGVTFPAAQLLVTISAAYERRRDQLAEQEADGAANSGPTLDQVVAEIVAAREEGES